MKQLCFKYRAFAVDIRTEKINCIFLSEGEDAKMLIYSGSKGQFNRDVESGVIADRIKELFYEH